MDAASLRGRVAAQDILPGEQLTAAEFTYSAGVAGQLAPNERGVEVATDTAHGLLDVLQTGDHVDVYGAAGQGNTSLVFLLAPNVVVLKTAGSGSGGGGIGGGGGQAGPVLLGIDKSLAPKVLWTSEFGKVWLALRGANAVSAAPTVTTLPDLVAGNRSLAVVNGAVHTPPTTATTTPTTGTHP
jgi:Flp pilus assembly protein CpaB